MKFFLDSLHRNRLLNGQISFFHNFLGTSPLYQVFFSFLWPQSEEQGNIQTSDLHRANPRGSTQYQV